MTVEGGDSTNNQHANEEGEEGPEGCYLLYEPKTSGGKLMMMYSKSHIPLNAIGFWCPGPQNSIQGFKFKQNNGTGRVDIITGVAGGSDSNRRKYYSGWCQFIRAAKQMNGYVIKFPNQQQGVEVDVVAFMKTNEQIVELNLDEGLIEVNELDAIAVIAKHNTTFKGLKTMTISNFLEAGNTAGASITLDK